MPRLLKYMYDQVIADYLDGMTQLEVANKNGLCRDAVGKILKRKGVRTREYTGSRRMSVRKHFWNFDFFSTVTKKSAYWAGFFLADGHLNLGKTGGATLVCYVKDIDENHLRQFLKDIDAEDDLFIYRGDGSVGFDLHYAGFKEQLPFWGIVPNKTKNFCRPNVDLTCAIEHFLRGWIDGDGSVYRYGRGARVSVSSGNKESFEWMESAFRWIGFDGHIGIHEVKDTGNYVLYIGGANQVAEICKLLLVDTEFCLERKWKNSRYDS